MRATVGFQGVAGAYSESAAIKYFGSKVRTKAFNEFDQVFKAITQGKVEYAVVPVENSLAGSIHENYDHLLHHRVWVCGEVKVRVRHFLLGTKKSKLSDIGIVYSHPQALAQCQGFIKRRLKKAVSHPYFDTAGSAQFVEERSQNHIAAIASEMAGKYYSLKVLASEIEDDVQNFTRFLVLRRSKVITNKRCAYKTSIVFSLKSIPGALHKALSIFAIREIDLLKIESRPIPGEPWNYMFYLDVQGKVWDKVLESCIRHLKEISFKVKVLGSYPADP